MSGDHDKYHGTAEVPKREWVGLTEDEIMDICKQHANDPVTEAGFLLNVFRTYEAKLREKNT